MAIFEEHSWFPDSFVCDKCHSLTIRKTHIGFNHQYICTNVKFEKIKITHSENKSIPVECGGQLRQTDLTSLGFFGGHKMKSIENLKTKEGEDDGNITPN